ncbi:DegV family EDD domain-containing protein [Mycoplasmopsis phocirhinis]|uniref:DegV family EDD domain-containing protein n=1 Tax=Mycoplasmopsis phocirhinis TaxID=142650 RepID=A0A4P6MN87_9BACT|nr:DegV family protein [Mycoplasmopsis phocirhinis]QBF34340.1 DegV family EDD domain-containing protein [Mycoplasmopsis phocirhinis]
MKYAIIVDSSSTLTKQQASKLNWNFLPLHININGTEYKDGIDINADNLFEFYGINEEATTSAVNLGEAEQLLNQLTKEYDKILIYPISKNLSGTCSSLTILSRNYKNVRVVQSIQVLQMILLDLVWFEHQMSIDSTKFDEYVETMEKGWGRYSITLIPKYNNYLVKGGRLHPTAAAVAKLFKIIPMICWDQGYLKKEGIGRTFNKTLIKAIEKKREIFPIAEQKELFTLALHSFSPQQDLNEFVNNIENILGVRPVIDLIAPVVAMHTGPEAMAVLAFELDKKIIELYKQKIMKLKNR